MIRWPKMQSFDMGFMRRTGTLIDINVWAAVRGWKVVQRDHDHDLLWVAPRWIGWLYRLLPNHFNVNLTGWKTEPSLFLANVAAPTWRIGILIRKRIPVLKVEFGGGSYDSQHHFYLPWGLPLFIRLTGGRRWAPHR